MPPKSPKLGDLYNSTYLLLHILERSGGAKKRRRGEVEMGWMIG